jgi:glycolate oxidase FAD binding subunit
MTTDLPILPKRPATIDDFASIIAECAEAGKQAQIVGSGSMPLASLDATRPIQPISTSRMNKLIEHAVSDMTVVAHAGMTLEQLQQQLAWKNQWLPIDPPAVNGRKPGSRTLGGLIATNSLGPLRLSLGDWRMLILGIRWVDARGTLIKGGGRTVKNVAGYSTPRMLIGSCGSLGAIAEVTLRTYARPADEQAAVFYAPSHEAAEKLIAAILMAEISPAYVQLVAGSSMAGNILDLPVPAQKGQAIIVGFLGEPKVCAAQVARMRELPAARGLESLAQTAAQSGRLRLWMTSEPDSTCAFRIHTLSSHAAQIIHHVEEFFAAQSKPAFIVSEAASGVIRIAVTSDSPGDVVAGLSGIARSANATLVVTHGAPWARSISSLEGRIKSQLDPALVFGP